MSASRGSRGSTSAASARHTVPQAPSRQGCVEAADQLYGFETGFGCAQVCRSASSSQFACAHGPTLAERPSPCELRTVSGRQSCTWRLFMVSTLAPAYRRALQQPRWHFARCKDEGRVAVCLHSRSPGMCTRRQLYKGYMDRRFIAILGMQ
jgi:hypothetical protein